LEGLAKSSSKENSVQRAITKTQWIGLMVAAGLALYVAEGAAKKGLPQGKLFRSEDIIWLNQECIRELRAC
jgi:hypothetical protein